MNRRGFFAGLAGLIGTGLAWRVRGAAGVAADGDYGGILVPDDIARRLLDEMQRQRLTAKAGKDCMKHG